MSKTADAEEQLAKRCLDLLRHAKRPMCSVTLSRLTGEHSADIFRLLSKHPNITANKGAGLTLFEVKHD